MEKMKKSMSMTDGSSKRDESSAHGQKFHKTILNDLRSSDIKRTLLQELKDIYYFYLDKDTRKKLASMGRLKRWFIVVFWLLKNMILKLTPVRRVLLVISILAILIGRNEENSALSLIAFVVLLLILMFELKDKLLAKDELATGRTVQSALIPDRNPELSGWEIWLYTRPANEVGGDLVDYVKLPKGKLGVALGDVAGKGLGAALLMAKLQATLRALAPSFHSLAELGARMNEIFCRDGLPSHFASLVYLELTPDSGSIHILNAGHFPPLILQENTVEEMKQGGSALGIVPDEIYNEQYIELQKNDLLFIYSDGLTEALNADEDFFGEERLRDVLETVTRDSAEGMGNQLLAEVERFVGKASQSDDLSIILLRRVK